MKLSKKILAPFLSRSNPLRNEPTHAAHISDDHDGDEVTQKSSADGERMPLVSASDIDAMLAVLEPLFFQEALPKFKHKSILYVASPDLSYLPLIRGQEIPSVVCMAPEFTMGVGDAAFPVHCVLNQYADPCFREGSFDALILPEASCRGIYFLTRLEYWKKILRPGGGIYLALPHPQARFLLPGRESRHRHSRTATFERVFGRCRELGVEVECLRELSARDIPAAALKSHPKWQRIKDQYEELPLLLGLCLKL